MKKQPSFHSKTRRVHKGFSLVELLIVILIMTILMTMGAMGIRGLTGGKGTSTGIANAEAVFSEARATAQGKGTSTRILIDARDINDIGTYLRRIVIATQDLNPDGTPKTTWTMSSRGYTLPDGTFFSRVLSKTLGAAAMTEQALTFTKPTDSGNYFVFEFNSQGICITPGAMFVIGSGSRPRGGIPIINGSAKRDFAAFTIWGSGETSTVRNTNQIGSLDSLKNF